MFMSVWIKVGFVMIKVLSIEFMYEVASHLIHFNEHKIKRTKDEIHYKGRREHALS